MTLALFAALLALPAAAQSTPSVECFANSADTTLASDMADEYLAENGIGEKPEGIEPRVVAVATQCLNQEGVSEQDTDLFMAANISHMVSAEMRRRMIEIGLDMAPSDALVAALIADPELDIVAYVDSRPSEFAVPTGQAAESSGLTRGHVLAMLGGYVGMQQQLASARELLAID
jgi:hypothetical protein